MLTISTDSDSPIEWSSEIIDEVQVEGFSQYIIETTQGDRKWLIRRNYKEFQAFHKKLSQVAQTPTEQAMLPKLPPKSYNLLFGPTKEFLEKRRDLLQGYLRTLAETPLFSANSDVAAFLQPERYKGLSEGWQGDIELPMYYPLITSESLRENLTQNDLYNNIKYKNTKNVNYFIKYGQSFLKTLFIFERSLNISPKFVAKAIIFDRQRASVRKAARFFAASLDVFRSAVSAATSAGDAEAASFLSKCLDVSEAASRWCATLSEEEAAVIRMAVKSPQAEIREIEWYKKEVGRVAATFDPYASSYPLESAKKVYMMLLDEIKCRSQAEQVVAVKTLRPLMYEMRSIVRFASTKKSSKAAAPPPDVIRVYFKKRFNELERAVAIIVDAEQNSLCDDDDDDEENNNGGQAKKEGEENENDENDKIVKGNEEKKEKKEGEEEEEDHSLFDLEDFVLCDDEEGEEAAVRNSSELSSAEVISRIKQLTSDIKTYKASAPKQIEQTLPPKEGEDGFIEPIEKILKDIDEICENALKLKDKLEGSQGVNDSKKNGNYQELTQE